MAGVFFRQRKACFLRGIANHWGKVLFMSSSHNGITKTSGGFDRVRYHLCDFGVRATLRIARNNKTCVLMLAVSGLTKTHILLFIAMGLAGISSTVR